MRSRADKMGSRRSSSSADTSIDEDTADQLLADDFIVPPSTVASRSGTMSYARPTSSAFEPQRRTPSFTSSQGQSPALPHPARQSRASFATNSPRASLPPSIIPSVDIQAAELGSSRGSIHDSETNPFNDPPEVGAITPLGEKPAILANYRPLGDKEVPAWAAETSDNAPSNPSKTSKKRRLLCISVPLILLLLAIVLIPVGLLVIKPKTNDKSGSGASNVPNMSDPSSLGIPASAIGTVLDSTKWLDWTDFNVTYTNATIGGLSVMGLNSTWDNSAQANANVPPLSSAFPYGKQPIRGISIGGWLVLEPYITPSLFSTYPLSLGIVDEYTLSKYLGQKAAAELEKHYSTFVTRESFEGMRDAGFDHVRISFPYWLVANVNSNDPYVEKVGWRYLLRGIEWAREVGLRVNICLHAAPGSQNGLYHSGRQGTIGWLNGTNGDSNAQATITFTSQLAAFFSQPRYQNIVTMYSIINEPNMILLGSAPVNQWTKEAYSAARTAGFNGTIVISDGFLPPAEFVGQFPDASYPGLAIDMHNYVMFNSGNLNQTHRQKIGFACVAWSDQLSQSVSSTTGFGGPTIVGEWSIADTDCAPYVNSIGQGTRWEGTYDGAFGTRNPGVPGCALATNCSCSNANAQASAYSASYKTFLADYFIAQTSSFERSWGWFYWTWDTENATQWSYKKLMDAGIVSLNKKIDNWDCNSQIPDYQSLGLPETF